MSTINEIEDVGTAYVKDLLKQIEQVARKSNSIPKPFSWWATPKASPANSATSNPSPLFNSEQVSNPIFLPPYNTTYLPFLFSFRNEEIQIEIICQKW
jgi:hypothetical protein